MSGITPEALERAQREWNEVDFSITKQSDRISSNLYRIRDRLTEMGLDLDQDETYELLAPGLTKAAFDAAVTHASINDVLQHYHRIIAVGRDDYVNTYNGKRAYGLQRMMEYELPEAEKNIAKTGVPDSLEPLARRELDMVLAAWHDGTLEDDMRRNAIRAAHDDFRTALSYYEQIQKQGPNDNNFGTARDGLSYADMTIKMIDWAGSYYKAEDIPAKYGMFGGWDEKAGTVKFSREAVEDLRTGFLIKELAVKFQSAKKFQDQGHFVLDASGSGHGMMVMPMQEIAEKLQEYGRDIHDPQTYKDIGTDIDTFRKCYQRERAAVLPNDQYRLIKPEFAL